MGIFTSCKNGAEIKIREMLLEHKDENIEGEQNFINIRLIFLVIREELAKTDPNFSSCNSLAY